MKYCFQCYTIQDIFWHVKHPRQFQAGDPLFSRLAFDRALPLVRSVGNEPPDGVVVWVGSRGAWWWGMLICARFLMFPASLAIPVPFDQGWGAPRSRFGQSETWNSGT